MDEIRAFIALELPSEIKTALSDLVSRLRTGHERSVKWVNPEGIHLTLKFLGNIPASKVAAIADVLHMTTAGRKPFTLELGKLGAFPNLKSPRVAWVGLEGNVADVVQLQKRLDQALIPLGFPTEKRAFSPHLTLGRVRDGATSRDRTQLSASLTSIKAISAPPFKMERLALMKSTLTPNGAIYDCLATGSIGTSP